MSCRLGWRALESVTMPLLEHVAHLVVLVHRDYRGRGLGRAVASAAVADALARGYVPQWRAAPAIALRLGFEELGWQVATQLGHQTRRTQARPQE